MCVRKIVVDQLAYNDCIRRQPAAKVSRRAGLVNEAVVHFLRPDLEPGPPPLRENGEPLGFEALAVRPLATLATFWAALVPMGLCEPLFLGTLCSFLYVMNRNRRTTGTSIKI